MGVRSAVGCALRGCRLHGRAARGHMGSFLGKGACTALSWGCFSRGLLAFSLQPSNDPGRTGPTDYAQAETKYVKGHRARAEL